MSALKDLVSTLKKHDGKVLLPILDMKLLSHNRVVTEVDEFFHPSSMGHPDLLCPRALFLQRHTPIQKYPKDLLVNSHSARTFRIFNNGDYVHLRFQTLLAECGVLHPKKGVGWEVDVHCDELGVTGHGDGIIYPEAQNNVVLAKVPTGHGPSSVPLIGENGFTYKILSNGGKWVPKGEPHLLEIKSIQQRYWDMLYEPKPEHKIQAICYMALLQQRPELRNLKKCIFVYESKNTQEIKEYVYPLNLDYWARLRSILLDVRRCGQAQKLPTRICDAVFEERARECPWVHVCFGTQKYSELIQLNGTKTDAKGTAEKAKSRRKG